ncbi:lipid IV(A) 4-amino-4-deoxy-L-arabinosyltransferase [Xenorhabdus szentirmaii]|uniref:Undecaprenyl phosphate-alpha-4-amino-4-deoxy-L-arabinose arabinosyl transferase n=1 Tax=Xenorhabdus szentirmaii TaxID=290112 RepID=A0AAW3Z2T8_9GAMM|nr:MULTISPECIES: lipid IV(A) 4-amino-4-deoxy-L-arabinosyltransferase [unclassified Xenorhabdus]MBD2793409.1 lipid IV(A) 4-amino-4-deoxy-L-arabinosyltransferase [Xenorhabdus sp. CUL]MBD2802693.1 lipid IV(A) 4-amino-4-deoxy-L-arabinosyltransferase [Xenorhabdus sp. M]MBD2825779.1 lipid IV(A) 4-amino-4-deoxy-L-arabinosyltransferase [Xenorhabdus sp. 5]
MLNTRASKAGAALMALFFILTYLLPLDGRLLWQPDETRYAEISREMLQRGDWIVPYFLDIRYFEKPVAGYWFNNISQWIFGHNNFAVRFGSVFSILISAILLYRLAMMMWKCRQTAFVASLIYLSMFLVLSIGSYSVLDPMFSLWITAGIVSCYWALKAVSIRERVLAWSVLGLTCGMAFMTKGFLALALPVIAMLPITIYQKRFQEMLRFGPLAVIFATLISLPWVIAIALREPDYWHYFFWVEHIQRFASEKAQHIAPIWYYVPILILGVLPWLGLLPGALIKGWKERRSHPEMFFLFSWFVIPFVFFSIAKGKLPTYVLPFIGPLAIMMAKYSVDSVKNGSMKVLKINGLVNLCFGMMATLALLIMEKLPNHSLYQPDEHLKWVMGIIIFGFWGIIGYLSFIRNGQYWLWSAACTIVLSLLIGGVLPSKTINSKLPQSFVREHVKELAESKYILSRSVGVGAAIAWELKRSDIYMFDRTGELEYGLDYPDSQYRYISHEEFPAWLEKARKKGQVALVFLLSSKEAFPELPKPDFVRRDHRFVLIIYKKQQ